MNDKREVTEFDLRAEEFKHPQVKPEDFEFRGDGKIVRKDRWEVGIRTIAGLFGCSREFEIDDLVEKVERLTNLDLEELHEKLAETQRVLMDQGLTEAGIKHATDNLDESIQAVWVARGIVDVAD